jgi:hypothetical protein
MRLTAIILTVLTLAISPTASADDKSKLSAEFEILDRFVGTWDMDITIKPAGAEAIKVKGAETRTWSPGKTVVHFENAKVASANDANVGGPEFQMLLTYDAATKSFRGMMMYGAGRSLITGIWDEATSTMTFNGTSPDDGSTFVFKNRFLDADHAESTGIQKNAKGEVFMEQTLKQTRRKK